MSDRIIFNKNYTEDGRWYFVLGVSVVPCYYKYQYSLTLELGFWSIEIGIGRVL